MGLKLDIIAHRGASGYCVDNSYESIQKAIDLGCKIIEIDIRLTKDKEIVLAHDEIYVVNNNKKNVTNSLLQDLDNIIELNNMLLSVPKHIIFYLDIKCEENESAFVIKINQILKQYPNRIFYIASFSKYFVSLFTSIYTNYRLGYIFELFDTKIYNILKNKIYFIVNKMTQTKEFMDFLEIDDKIKYVYTINNVVLIDKYIEYIDGIITDYPDIMLLH